MISRMRRGAIGTAAAARRKTMRSASRYKGSDGQRKRCYQLSCKHNRRARRGADTLAATAEALRGIGLQSPLTYRRGRYSVQQNPFWILPNPCKSSPTLSNLPQSFTNLVKAFQIWLILPNPMEFDQLLAHPSKFAESFKILSHSVQSSPILRNHRKSSQIFANLMHSAKYCKTLPNPSKSYTILENLFKCEATAVATCAACLHEVARSCTKSTSQKKKTNP